MTLLSHVPPTHYQHHGEILSVTGIYRSRLKMRSVLLRAVYLSFDGWRKINVRSATSKKNRGFPLKHPHRDESLQVHASHLEVGWVYFGA